MYRFRLFCFLSAWLIVSCAGVDSPDRKTTEAEKPDARAAEANVADQGDWAEEIYSEALALRRRFRGVRHPADGKAVVDHLAKMGNKKAFAILEHILDDPDARHEASNVFTALVHMEGDRRRFLPAATRFLACEDPSTRYRAVWFIGEVGSAAEAPPLVALLNEEDAGVAVEAAWALGKVGGANEAVALEIWLQGVGPRDFPALREKVEEASREILKRLASPTGQ